MTESTSKPDPANAQVTGGGGNEPDPDVQPASKGEPGATASGVDLKSNDLPDPEPS